jgi:hypothetical protein
MYLASRGIIAARIKERANKMKKKEKSRRPGRSRIFDYGTYARIGSSIERFFFAWMKSFCRI